MKTLFVIFSICGTTLIMACGNGKSNVNASDTGSSVKKADTSVVTGSQKSVKPDSIGGDPAAKGSEDPNAHQPKK